MTRRHGVPRLSALQHLLGELYVQLGYTSAGGDMLQESITHNPFKLSAYLRYCTIVHDITTDDHEKHPHDLFQDFHTLKLAPLTPPPLAPVPNPDLVGIHTATEVSPLQGEPELYMPALRNDYPDVSLDHLRRLMHHPFATERFFEMEVEEQ